MIFMHELKFIKIKKEEEALEVQTILKKCGDYLHKIKKLSHWRSLYSIKNILVDIKEGDVYFIKESEVIVGTFTLIWNYKEKNLYLKKFAITPENMNKGIGGKSLKYIYDLAKLEKMNQVELDVYTESVDSINFYKKNKFKIREKKSTKNFFVFTMIREVD